MLYAGAAASLTALSGCGIFGGRINNITEQLYTVEDTEGDDFKVRITYDDGAREKMQLALYFLSQSGLEKITNPLSKEGSLEGGSGSGPVKAISIKSPIALKYVSGWADDDGDSHITNNEADIFCQASQRYNWDRSVPTEFQTYFKRAKNSKSGTVVGSKR